MSESNNTITEEKSNNLEIKEVKLENEKKEKIPDKVLAKSLFMKIIKEAKWWNIDDMWNRYQSKEKWFEEIELYILDNDKKEKSFRFSKWKENSTNYSSTNVYLYMKWDNFYYNVISDEWRIITPIERSIKIAPERAIKIMESILQEIEAAKKWKKIKKTRDYLHSLNTEINPTEQVA